MCGITGYFMVDAPENALRESADVLRKRGPDEEGFFREPGVGIASRRLSIIDVAGGRQPITNEDGSVIIVQNGEIYNYVDLRRMLIAKDHTFKTQSDTEVIAHAYEEWGEECLVRFSGMFAIGLYDRRRHRLLLARDRVGKKPLHYCAYRGGILFASEIKSLLRFGIQHHIDDEAVKDYFCWGFIPAPKTVYREIRKLRPGEYLVADASGHRVLSYDDWIPDRATGASSPDLSEILRQAVRRRLVADVEVASLLSGGIDSTIVTGLAQEESKRRLRSFSIGFEEDSFNETPFARIAARRFQTNHSEFTCSYSDERDISTEIGYFDEPFADDSAIPTSLLSLKTAEHVKVCLSGDGGDELFAGYPRYALHARYDRYLRFLPAKRFLAKLARRSRTRLRGHNLLHWSTSSSDERYLETTPFFHEDEMTGVLETGFCRRTGDYDPRSGPRRILDRVRHLDLLTRFRYLDLKFYLPEDLMVKVDRMSMMHSLEVRCPFLDRDVIEAAFAIPSSQHVRHGISKAALKRAFKGWLPEEILMRQKMGFAPPLAAWLRGRLAASVSRLLLNPHALINAFIRPEAISGLVLEHNQGIRDHHSKLWALFVFEMWAQSANESQPS